MQYILLYIRLLYKIVNILIFVAICLLWLIQEMFKMWNYDSSFNNHNNQLFPWNAYYGTQRSCVEINNTIFVKEI